MASTQSKFTHVDVAVLGGGPAGAAVATTLARSGASTLLVERAPCRDFRWFQALPFRTKPLLQKLGAWEPFTADGHREATCNRSAWGSAEITGRDFLCDLQGSGWYVDRQRFDTMMARIAVEAGAGRRVGTQPVAVYPQAGGGWMLDLESEQGTETLSADMIVDATGRSRWFTQQIGVPKITYDRMVAVVGILASDSARRNDEPFALVESTEDGWWHTAPLADGTLEVMYLTDADLLDPSTARTPAGWSQLLSRTVHTRARIRDNGYTLTFEPRIVPTDSSRLCRIIGPNWLAVGDAAFAYDPLTAQGLHTAVTSGILAGEALVRCLAGDCAALRMYADRVESAYSETLRKRAANYSLERRWLDAPFWSRRTVRSSAVRSAAPMEPHRYVAA